MDISAIEPLLDCGRIHFRLLSFLISIRDAEGGIGEKMGIGRGKTEEEEPLLILLLPRIILLIVLSLSSSQLWSIILFFKDPSMGVSAYLEVPNAISRKI